MTLNPALHQGRAHRHGHFQGEVLFIAVNASRTRIVAAVAGVEHHGVEVLGVLDVAGAEHRVDQLAQVEAGEQHLAVVGLHRETEDEFDVVDQHLLGADLGLEDQLGGAKPEMAALEAEGGEAVQRVVEITDAVCRHVVAPADLDDSPSRRSRAGR
jgi:hypothetical protein